MIPPQHAVAYILEKGSAFLHVDARQPGVDVPSHSVDSGGFIILQVGYDLPVPIEDLEVDEEGVCGTLSFNRTPYYVTVPWGAVWAVSDEHGSSIVFQGNLSDDVIARIEHPDKPKLRLIQGGRK